VQLAVLSFTFTSFDLPFWKQKHVPEQKQLVQISSHLSAHVYTCVLSAKTWKPKNSIYIDLSYIDPQTKVLDYCFK